MNYYQKVLLGLMLFAIANSASAFPLSNGNGYVNATVFGTYRFDDYLVLDINSSDQIEVVLVDADDKFYENDKHFDSEPVGYHFGNFVSSRDVYGFHGIPQDAEIKRVRITPTTGDPFSIEWTGVPEVEGTPLSMKFYGLSAKIANEGDCMTSSNKLFCELDESYWIIDVKLTNTENTQLEVKSSDFAIIDQFGYRYRGYNSDQVYGMSQVLMPSESMRTNIRFGHISKLSRPVYLVYDPSDMKMDISAWS